MFNYTNIFYSFLMLFYIYNVKYIFIPVSSYIWSTFIFIFIFTVFVFNKKNMSIDKNILLILFVFSIFIFISIMSLYFNFDTFDFSVLRLVFVLIVAIFIVPSVLYIEFKNNPIYLLKVISSVGIINSFFILGMFFIPEFKYLYQIVVVSSFEKLNEGVDIENNLIGLRMIGINGFSAYSTATVQIILASIYIFYISLKNNKANIFQIFIILFIILSAIISARTSFVILPFFILYYFYMFGIKSSTKLLSFLFLFLIISSILVQFILEPKELDFFINWSTELFENGLSSGSVQTNLNMFKYGFNDFSVLGDFKLRNEEGGYYMNVDIGWHRLFFAFGLLGSFSLFLLLFTIIFSFSLNKGNLILFFIFLIICIIMIKGAIIFDAYPLLTLLVILKLISPKLSHLRKKHA